MHTDLPTASAFPENLVIRDQWLAWREQERNGKETKVPVNPHTGSFASSTNSDTWGSFDTAREYVADGTADGLGFVFTGDDPLVGIDLDDCRIPETGSLSTDAEVIVDTLNSYTEVSPSGTGVHVILIGPLPGDRNRADWIELYEEARFFTMTGMHVESTPVSIEPRPEALTSIYQDFVADSIAKSHAEDATDIDEAETDNEHDTAIPSPMESTPTETETNGLSDQAVIGRAHDAANGEKFGRLWRGQTTGYESHSEADMALCAILAFWTGGERAQIDRLFRDSGLMRPKWDEQHYADGSTYGAKTLDRVLEWTDEVYQPEQSTSTSEAGRSPATEPESDLTPEQQYDLQERIAELSTRKEKHLSIIADLQAEVERLEAANAHLAAGCSGFDSDTDEPTESNRESHSFLSKLRRLLQ